MTNCDKVGELTTQKEKLVDFLEIRDTDHGNHMNRLETTLESVTWAMEVINASMERMKILVVLESSVSTAKSIDEDSSIMLR